MKLLYVITRANQGGAQVNVLSLAKGAATAGHQVTVLTGETGWLTDELAQTGGITTKTAASLARTANPGKILAFFGEFKRYLATTQPDLIHFHSSNALLGVLAAGRTPTVVTIHGWSWLNPGWLGSRTLRLAYKWLMSLVVKRAHATILVSKADADLGHKLNLPFRRAVTIHNGIKTTNPAVAANPAAAKMHLQASADAFLIGTIARFDYAKQLDLLVDAVALLRQELPTDQFSKLAIRLVGDGPERTKIADLISQLNLTDTIKLLPGQPAAPLFAGFDLFILCSRYEGLPYSLLEAAAAGIPLLATDVGGVSEVVENQRTGQLLPPDDANRLAAAINWSLRHPIELSQLAVAARQKIESDFSERQMLEQTLALYNSLVSLNDTKST